MKQLWYFLLSGNPVDIMPWMRHFFRPSFNRFLSILQAMDAFCLKKQLEHQATYDPGHIRDVTDALLHCSHNMDNAEKTRLGLTDEHILTTVQDLIGAGFDTISTTLQWSLLFMATHPEIQSQVQQEVMQVLGQRNPCVKDMVDMPYTEAVILETMRHSCIFPFALPHRTTKNTILGGYFIPDKTLVFINMWSTTRDPTHFPDPERFDPQRFLDDGCLNAVMEHFLPFGAGRRRCPGEQLAKTELFIFFVSMMQAFRVHTVPGLTYTLAPKYGLTLKPQDFKIKVIPNGL